MTGDDETVIMLSKKKIVLLFLGSLVFVVIGFVLLLRDESTIGVVTRVAVGLSSIVLFSACGVFAAVKFFDQSPGLKFNSSGIVNNSSYMSVNFIPWTEIVGHGIHEIQKQKFLVVKVRDPQKYIASRNWFKQELIKANSKMCGSPITISSSALKVDFPELQSLFCRYQEKYGLTNGDR